MASCSQCGVTNPEGSRFCADCGQPVGALTAVQSTQTAATVLTTPHAAQIHLKRAWDLIAQLSDSIGELRQRVLRHEAEMDRRVERDSGSFVADFAGVIAGRVKGERALGRDKSSLISDIQLAHGELDKAAAIDPETTIHVDGADVGVSNLRAALLRINGVVEMTWGKAEQARQLLIRSSALVEDPYTHFLLGSAYESEYQPKEALKHFERCLELDPNGEDSVSALQAANAMKNYKKRFRGNWGTFFLLLLFWPAAIYYLIKNWK